MDLTSSSYVGRDFVTNDDKIHTSSPYQSHPYQESTPYPNLTTVDQRSEYSDSSDSTDSETSSAYHKRKKRENEEKSQVIVEPGDYLDYRFFWMLGLLLLLVSASYYYWSTIECCIPENDETNLTIQYALEKFGPIEIDSDITGTDTRGDYNTGGDKQTIDKVKV
jgi:hypothetical protein